MNQAEVQPNGADHYAKPENLGPSAGQAENPAPKWADAIPQPNRNPCAAALFGNPGILIDYEPFLHHICAATVWPQRRRKDTDMVAVADSVVRARVGSDLKKEAAVIFESMGITMSDAIRMMLVRVVAEKALPFEVKSPNAVTQEAIAASRADDVATFASVDELFADLNDEDELSEQSA